MASNVEISPCPVCKEPNYGQTVQCDGICQQYFHVGCVGLTLVAAAKLTEWTCSKCKKMNKSLSFAGAHSSTLVAPHQVSRIVPNNEPSPEEFESCKDSEPKGIITRSKAKQALKTRQNSETGTKPKVPPAGSVNDGKMSVNDLKFGTEHVPSPPKTPSIRSKRSSLSKASTTSKSSIASAKVTLLEQKASIMREKRETLAKQMELLDQEQDAVDEALETVRQMEDDALTSASSNSVEEPEGILKPPGEPEGTLKPQELNKLKSMTLNERVDMFKKTLENGNRDLHVEPDNQAGDWRNQESITQNVPFTNQLGGLDLAKWTARQTVPQTLAKFSGAKGQWAAFINAYENSTSLCGLSNAENLTRLQNCLVDPARTFVNHLLNDPASVDEIIETLRMIYGNPQKILKDMIDEAKQSSEVEENDLASIVKYALLVRNICTMIKSTGLTNYANSPLLLEELVEKLPKSLQLSWVQQCGETNDLSDFDAWLNRLSKNICKNITNIDLTSPQRTTKTTNKKKPAKEIVNTIDETQQQPIAKCYACSRKCTELSSCETFKGLNDDDKWQVVKKNGLCRQCLTKHVMRHPFICKIAVKCDVKDCTGKHHPLMHRNRKEETETPVVEENHFHNDMKTQQACFRYIPVKLLGDIKELDAIAFLDCGSSGTFIEEKTAQSIGLTGPVSALHLKFSGNSHRIEMNSMTVSLSIKGVGECRAYQLNDVHTVESLNLREQNLDYMELADRFEHLKNLPVVSYKSSKPTILIGLRHWKYALEREIRVDDTSESPIASRCLLGWSVYAGMTANPQSINYCESEECLFYMDGDDLLNESVKHHFAIDSLGVKVQSGDLTSIEDRRAMKILNQTTKKVGRRYETGLLWKDDVIHLPDSKGMAMKRLLGLEKRFTREPWLGEDMRRQIDEYVVKEYARILSDEELAMKYERVWYLPIFPALNPNKPGKVRMVYDARAEVDGVSLNGMLLKGPDELPCLLKILLRFRQNKVGISGDIKEMFHQIIITPPDQQVQRFLFRDTSGEIKTYILQRMSFGAKCSPSTAEYVKNVNAKLFATTHPRAVECIVQNHYVDDLLDSIPTVEEAIQLAKDVSMIHEEGGFVIRGWKSNCADVLEAMGETTPTNGKVDMNVDHEDVTEKVLGMFWITTSDEFTYSLQYNKGSEEVLQGTRKPTRREMLRILMSIYDPMGLLSHFTSYLKVQFQNTWRTGLDWDDVIDDDQHQEWLRWLNILPQIEDIRIPRCYLNEFASWNDVSADLHVFVDASKDCSACVMYIRMEHEMTGEVSCSLIAARTRVAPIKLMSIPRLELIAAIIGTRLASEICEALTIDLQGIVYWSDSKTVLSWIRSDTKRIKGLMVKYRVSEIQDTTNVNAWRYVPSKLNIADQATKWKARMKIDNDSEWFQGPEFLYRAEERWPVDISRDFSTKEEMLMTTQHEVKPLLIDFTRFSKWNRLVKTVVYVREAIPKLMMKMYGKKITKQDDSNRMLRAEVTIIRICQKESFPIEMHALETNKPIPCTSPIYKDWPYLDENGVLRSKGRIDAATCVPFETRRPIILSSKHHVTRLIMEKYHDDYKHLHHETVINEFRQMYMVNSPRRLLKYIRTRCPRCAYLNAKPSPPQMAALPKARLAAYARPFAYVGIDCLGPLTVTIGRRSEKRWICLFTCLTIRGVHLEVLHGMDSSSFILAYRNFTQRRGVPVEVYCDNGTNFVGGERLMREEFKKVEMRDVAAAVESSETVWKFNPPDSPHMGGSWERLVKSVKNAFYATTPDRNLSDPLLNSYVIEIENMINSRPLTYLPSESEDEESLTPNHFIRGASKNGQPLCKFSDNVKFVKESWRRSQLYAQRYWERWVKEYLPTLTRRSKWHEQVPPLAVGDVVLIVDPKSIRNCWQKGRIVSVREGPDHQVRSATVKLPNGSTLERPAVKLAKIDIGKGSEGNPGRTDSFTGREDVKNEATSSVKSITFD